MSDYLNKLAQILNGGLTSGVNYLRSPERTQQMQGLGGLLADALTQGNTDAGKQMGLLNAAVAESRAAKNPFNAGPASQALQAQTGNFVANSIGPLSTKFVYPQQAALELAQKNAALPVEKGGLGLRPNNTPAERAAAMGFDADIFHGQSQPNPKREYIEGLGSVVVDQPALTPISQLKSGAGNAEGGAFFGVNDPFVANGYAGNGAVYPMQTATKSLKESGVPAGGSIEGFNRMLDKNKSRYFNSELKQAKADGHGGAIFRNVEDSAGQPLYDIPSDIYAVSDPSLIRSRFAAFDPMRRTSPDILAGLMPLSSIADEDVRNKLSGLLAP